MLALERAVVSSLPREPARPLAVALTPRALALQRVVVLMMPRALVLPLAFVPRALELLPGPCLSVTAGSHRCPGLPYGSEIDCCLLQAVLVRPPQSKRANPGKCVS